jgi:hypothetical protein
VTAFAESRAIEQKAQPSSKRGMVCLVAEVISATLVSAGGLVNELVKVEGCVDLTDAFLSDGGERWSVEKGGLFGICPDGGDGCFVGVCSGFFVLWVTWLPDSGW